jgi:hypothetical protein
MIWTLALLVLLGAIDSVSVISALPSIAVSLSSDGKTASAVETFWSSNGYLLAQTVIIPVYESANENAGRKICILSATTLSFGEPFVCSGAEYGLVGWVSSGRSQSQASSSAGDAVSQPRSVLLIFDPGGLHRFKDLVVVGSSL